MIFNNHQMNLKLLVKCKSLVFEQLVAVCATSGAVIRSSKRQFKSMSFPSSEAGKLG